ncbi:HAMP domain-containing protein [Pseudomonas sp. 7P_10.2_Bac1]|uniref:HD domain-containing phosphohydrolase n=1 Tax=Pseudomonas sp. 7P_10.2_Bac1 TaxID=2971614 RepID=UPI0021C720FC|nr:HD domain-containing phosphohydrolase [Pseudomonas sp. 7P_10.2_Bac1]MCU1728638.1 HAMP domain-containing protein [Pseudomonas sp. 7P_10.2_Bac1]
MPLTMPASQRLFPLHVHISVVFTFLLLLMGVALGVFNYRQNTRIILDSSQKLFNQIEQDVQQDLLKTYQPLRNTLNLLARNPAVQTDQFDARLQLLPTFVQALKDNSALSALYIGDSQGNFFQVRPLRTDAIKKRQKAPDQAAYEVWTVQRSGRPQGAESTKLFFDETLTLLAQHSTLNNNYDPRDRSWFIPSHGSIDHSTTSPYLFFTTEEIGTTLSKRSSSKTVIAADLTLSELSRTLARHTITPSTQIVLFDASGQAVAYPDTSKLLTGADQLPAVTSLHPALERLINQGADANHHLNDGQRQWIVSQANVDDGGSNGLQLALMVPEDELLADAYRLRWEGALVALALLLLCLPLGWLTSRMLVRPLKGLVREANAIRSFDFNYPVQQRSPVLEIQQLAESMRHMKETLASFFEITASLSAHTRFEPLLQSVLVEMIKIAQAQAGLIYLTENDSDNLELKGLIINDQTQNLSTLAPGFIHPTDDQAPAWLSALKAGQDSVVCTLDLEHAGELGPIMAELDSLSIHVISIRLHNRHGETVGVLALILNNSNTGRRQKPLSLERIAFIKAVSGAAAVSIESQRLQERQKQLLNAFIQLLAGAIDAKSPYTGGHCQRVPELTFMLAKAAEQSQAPQFAQYNPTEEEWEGLYIAAWLHDCGKVTTPEYVVDKATKLETLYDRIHEIRTRFEVLKRDAWIDYWQALATGGIAQQLAEQRDARLAALDDDFAFVARCNLGGEAMAEADLGRLRAIAGHTWSRTLDDRLGVSWEENKRQAIREAQPLPVTETLLADKPEHVFTRAESELIASDNPWGFKLDVPPCKFNRGELYNLSITRGTLTSEERYIINHHIVQTILMLSRLPFPSYLGNIAEMAGGHHERMDGMGYPKRLNREEMSLPARMMAIADIFEALTASDRPYKRGKTLNEALTIMAGMCHDGHIDPPLFELFMREQVFMPYARQYLEPQQIDTVDVDALMLKAGIN